MRDAFCCCFVLPFGVLFPFHGDKGKTVVFRHFFRWGLRDSSGAGGELLQVCLFCKGYGIPLRTVGLRDLVGFCMLLHGWSHCSIMQLDFLAGVKGGRYEPPQGF